MEKVAELICSTVEDRSIMTGILVKNGYTVGWAESLENQGNLMITP